MYGVDKITVNEDIALVTFYNIPCDLGIIAEIFNEVANQNINIDMISQTAPLSQQVNLSFTLPAEELLKVFEVVNRFREEHSSIKVMVNSGNCKIQLFGSQMCQMHGVASRAFTAAARCGQEVMLITTSEVDISLLVTEHAYPDMVAELEKEFALKAE